MDPWQLDEPSLERVGQKSKIRLSQASAEFADLEDRLIFSRQNARDRLSGEVECTTRLGNQVKAELMERPATSWSLVSLLPKEFFRDLTLNPEPFPEWTCSWRFRVHNDRGSVHSFRLPSQRLKFRDLPMAASQGAESVALQCPTWSAQIDRPTNLQAAIEDLPRTDRIQGVESRHKIRQGICVLIADFENGQRGLVRRHPWVLPPPKIEIQLEATGSYQPSSRPLSEIFRLRVINRETHEVWIEFKKQFQARILGESSNTPGTWLASLHTPIEIQAVTDFESLEFDDRRRVRLAGGSEIQLRMSLKRLMFCPGSLERRIGLMSEGAETWGINWVEHSHPEHAAPLPTRALGPQLEGGKMWSRDPFTKGFVELLNPIAIREGPCADRDPSASGILARSDD
jgi:hypothetical protein